jgi:predicted dehydrogenase
MINVAVIGAGEWGPNLIRNFYDLSDCRVGWVIDHNEARLVEAKARYAGVGVTTDAAVAIDDPEIDAIVIATPTSTHYELALAALENGKHVLVEKPIATSAQEARTLTRLSVERDLILMVGHVFLFNDGIREVKRYISSGELGDVYYMSMTRTNLGPLRTDVNAAWDLAAHDISIADYCFEGKAVSVSAIGGTWINPGIHDAVFSTLRYEGSKLVHLEVSWLNPRKARHMTVVGSKRMLTFDDMNMLEPIRIYDKGVNEPRRIYDQGSVGDIYADTYVTFRASIRDGSIVIPKVQLGEPLRAQCRDFVESIHAGRPPITDGAFGTAVVETLEAIGRSLDADGAEQVVDRT